MSVDREKQIERILRRVEKASYLTRLGLELYVDWLLIKQKFVSLPRWIKDVAIFGLCAASVIAFLIDQAYLTLGLIACLCFVVLLVSEVADD